MIDKIKKELATNISHTGRGGEFLWSDRYGIGYLPSESTDDQVYDQAYWDKYVVMSKTDIGRKLTQARADLANKYYDAETEYLLDIGIGAGQFVEAMDCFGTDVNKVAIKWLEKNHAYMDLEVEKKLSWVSMWDVLEHIDNPDDILRKVKNGCFISMPIYRNFEHCINSKHFRPNEHIWYFTTAGLLSFMDCYGFKCVEMSTIETKIGREDIQSFVFIRQ